MLRTIAEVDAGVAQISPALPPLQAKPLDKTEQLEHVIVGLRRLPSQSFPHMLHAEKRHWRRHRFSRQQVRECQDAPAPV